MNKILSFICLSFGLIANVSADDFKPFTSIDQALQFCPAPNQLTFKPKNYTIPNSAGTVIGFNMTWFESIAPAPGTAMRPKYMDPNYGILDAGFRMAEGMYGYISNNVVSCLYSYTGQTGVKVLITLR